MDKKDSRIFFTLFVLMIVSVCLSFSTSFENAFETPKRFFLYLFTALILIFNVYTFLKYRWNFPKQPGLIPFALFALFTAVSCVASSNRIVGVYYVFDTLSYVTIFFSVVILFNREDIKKTTPYILIITGAVCIYSIVQHLGIDPVPWVEDFLIKHRSISTLGNPDFLSAFLSMIIPLVFILAYHEENIPKSLGLFAFWGILILTNIITYSRTGLVSMVAGMIAAMIFLGRKTLFKHKWKITTLIVLVIMALLGAIAAEVVFQKGHTLIERLKAFTNPNDPNVGTRFALWKSGWLIFINNPFLGIGPGNFDTVYLQYRFLEPTFIRGRVAMPGSSHNIFIDIASQSGIFTLLSFLAVLAVPLASSIKFLQKDKPKKDGDPEKKEIEKYLLAGFIGAVTAFIIHHLAVFSTMPTDLFFWSFLAFMWIITADKQTGNKKDEKAAATRLKAGGWVIIAVVALAGLIGVFFISKNTAADYYLKKANAMRQGLSRAPAIREKQKFFNASFHYFEQVNDLAPLNYKGWLSRGKLLEEFSYTSTNPEATRNIINEAVKSYKKAIRLQPDNPYPYADMGRMLARWEMMEPALKLYSLAVQKDPYNPILITDLAKNLEKTGKYKKAESLFEKVIRLYPDGYWTYGNLGIFYYRRKKYEKALKYLDKALKINRSEQIRVTKFAQNLGKFGSAKFMNMVYKMEKNEEKYVGIKNQIQEKMKNKDD